MAKKLSAAEAAKLDDLERKCSDAQSSLRGAEKNIEGCDQFLAEAEVALSLEEVSDASKANWKARKEHCEKVQRPREVEERAIKAALLAKAEKDLSQEKGKHGPTLKKVDGEWVTE